MCQSSISIEQVHPYRSWGLATRTARGHDKKALTRSHQLGTFRLFMRYAVAEVGDITRDDITYLKKLIPKLGRIVSDL